MGGGSRTAHTLFGKLGKHPYCQHRAVELLEVAERERIVQIARAEGKPFETGLFECIEEAWPARELAQARALAESGLGYLQRSGVDDLGELGVTAHRLPVQLEQSLVGAWTSRLTFLDSEYNRKKRTLDAFGFAVPHGTT
jgi:hypothetical protein